jgi:hypothetical protein
LDLKHSFQIWDVSNGANTINYGLGISTEIISWSPDGRFIAESDINGPDGGIIHIWRVGWGHSK